MKSNSSIQSDGCSGLSQRQRPGCRAPLPSSFPGSWAQQLSLKPAALSCVCEHLCFISIYFVHLLARCVLRYQKSLREVILGVWERSTIFSIEMNGNCCFTLCHLGLGKVEALLWESRGNLVTICVSLSSCIKCVNTGSTMAS